MADQKKEGKWTRFVLLPGSERKEGGEGREGERGREGRRIVVHLLYKVLVLFRKAWRSNLSSGYFVLATSTSETCRSEGKGRGEATRKKQGEGRVGRGEHQGEKGRKREYEANEEAVC